LVADAVWGGRDINVFERKLSIGDRSGKVDRIGRSMTLVAIHWIKLNRWESNKPATHGWVIGQRPCPLIIDNADFYYRSYALNERRNNFESEQMPVNYANDRAELIKFGKDAYFRKPEIRAYINLHRQRRGWSSPKSIYKCGGAKHGETEVIEAQGGI
jgi:hypothetical protein